MQCMAYAEMQEQVEAPREVNFALPTGSAGPRLRVLRRADRMPARHQVGHGLQGCAQGLLYGARRGHVFARVQLQADIVGP
eukprot:9019582-Pyramimonas_sp.AAC.1